MKTISEKQTKGSTKSSVMSVLYGVICAFLISILLLAVFSLVISAKDVPSSAVFPFVCISIAGGGFCGGLLTSRIYGSKGLMLGGTAGLFFFLILCLVGLLMRQANLNTGIAFKLVIAVICGGIGGILGVNSRRRRARI